MATRRPRRIHASSKGVSDVAQSLKRSEQPPEKSGAVTRRLMLTEGHQCWVTPGARTRNVRPTTSDGVAAWASLSGQTHPYLLLVYAATPSTLPPPAPSFGPPSSPATPAASSPLGPTSPLVSPLRAPSFGPSCPWLLSPLLPPTGVGGVYRRTLRPAQHMPSPKTRLTSRSQATPAHNQSTLASRCRIPE